MHSADGFHSIQNPIRCDPMLVRHARTIKEPSRISQIKDSRSLSDFHTIFNVLPFFVNKQTYLRDGPENSSADRMSEGPCHRRNSRSKAKKFFMSRFALSVRR